MKSYVGEINAAAAPSRFDLVIPGSDDGRLDIAETFLQWFGLQFVPFALYDYQQLICILTRFQSFHANLVCEIRRVTAGIGIAF